SHPAPTAPSFLCSAFTSPLHSTLFPYTTLFRSDCLKSTPSNLSIYKANKELNEQCKLHLLFYNTSKVDHFATFCSIFSCWFVNRSEEHTSELQSRFDLVCRLLLEKKKTHKKRH